VSNFRSGGAFDNEAWAVFAQATYDLSDVLHLTVGGRYTDEQKAFTPDQIIYQNYYAGFSNLVPADNPLFALDAPFLQAGERILPLLEKEIEISEFTPMVNLSYDLNDDLMVYLSYSEGFKSGGFTQRVFPPVVAGFTAPAGDCGYRSDPNLSAGICGSGGVGLQGHVYGRASAGQWGAVHHGLPRPSGAGVQQRGAGNPECG
jgi:iron complex outermembrane receptor protein